MDLKNLDILIDSYDLSSPGTYVNRLFLRFGGGLHGCGVFESRSGFGKKFDGVELDGEFAAVAARGGPVGVRQSQPKDILSGNQEIRGNIHWDDSLAVEEGFPAEQAIKIPLHPLWTKRKDRQANDPRRFVGAGHLEGQFHLMAEAPAPPPFRG